MSRPRAPSGTGFLVEPEVDAAVHQRVVDVIGNLIGYLASNDRTSSLLAMLSKAGTRAVCILTGRARWSPATDAENACYG